MIRIGVSACFFHPDNERPTFKGKTLLYGEQSLLHMFQNHGAIVYILPSSAGNEYANVAEDCDALVLAGGTDLAPRSYGEEPIDPKWQGDFIRDQYEIKLTRAFVAAGKPVLGVCRGAQLINVAFGGTLYQDIPTQLPSALNHRDHGIYDQNFHDVTLAPKSWLHDWYARESGIVNSVHHQAIKTVAPGFVAEAHAADGVVEAIRSTQHEFICAVQWHPEFLDVTSKNSSLLDAATLIKAFFAAITTDKERR
jgi:putative glutamine amidotransferase